MFWFYLICISCMVVWFCCMIIKFFISRMLHHNSSPILVLITQITSILHCPRLSTNTHILFVFGEKSYSSFKCKKRETAPAQLCHSHGKDGRLSWPGISSVPHSANKSCSRLHHFTRLVSPKTIGSFFMERFSLVTSLCPWMKERPVYDPERMLSKPQNIQTESSRDMGHGPLQHLRGSVRKRSPSLRHLLPSGQSDGWEGWCQSEVGGKPWSKGPSLFVGR